MGRPAVERFQYRRIWSIVLGAWWDSCAREELAGAETYLTMDLDHTLAALRF